MPETKGERIMTCQTQAKQQEYLGVSKQSERQRLLERMGKKAVAQKEREYQERFNKRHPGRRKQYQEKYNTLNPWSANYSSAKNRCNNPKNTNFKRYGGRGIKFLMSLDDFKFIWIRDKAEEMLYPSIDRVDVNGDYVLSNCRFVERSFNSSRVHKERTHCKKGHEYTLENARIYPKARQCRMCAKLRERERRLRVTKQKSI